MIKGLRLNQYNCKSIKKSDLESSQRKVLVFSYRKSISTQLMELEAFREFCLGLGSVTEKMPFGRFAVRYDSILAFYVMGHMFCFIDVNDFHWVNVRLTPNIIDWMRATYTSVGNPMNQSLKYWIRLDFDGDIPSHDIYNRVKEAYDIVLQKYSKNNRK